MSSAAAAGVGIAGLVVGIGIGYYAGGAGTGQRTITSTSTATETSTATSTVTSTAAPVTSSSLSSSSFSSSASSSLSSLSSSATASSSTSYSTVSLSTTTVSGTALIAGGPGTDYYYDPKLSGTTINYLASDAPENVVELAVIPQFEKETGIKVNLTILNANDVSAKAATVLAAQSNQYDVIDSGYLGAEAYSWYKQGWITPLQKFFDLAPTGYNPSDVFPAVSAACSTFPEDGSEVMFLPPTIAEEGWQFRQDLLEEAGIPFPVAGQIELGGYDDIPPGNKVTYEDLLTAGAKVSKPPSSYGMLFPADAPLDAAILCQEFIWQYNKNWVTKNFTSNWLDSDVQTGLQQWANAVLQNVSDPTTFNYGDYFTLCNAGRVASGWGSATSAPNFFVQGSALTGDNWKLGWFPGEKVNSTYLAAKGPAIISFSNNQNAAFSLLSFMTSPRIQSLYAQNGMATIRSSVASALNLGNSTNWGQQWLAQAPKWFNVMKPVGTSGAKLVYTTIFVKCPQTITLFNDIGNAMAKLYSNSYPVPASAVSQVCTQLDSITNQFFKSIGFANTKTYEYGT